MDSMYSVSAQGAGAMVGHFNQMRMDEFIRNINYQDINLDHAMNEINEARKFIKSRLKFLVAIELSSAKLLSIWKLLLRMPMN